MENELDILRGRIDEIDDGLVRLLTERMEIAERIGRYKETRGLPVRDPEREERLIARVRALAGDGCADSAEEIYRGILAASRARQSAGRKPL